MYWFCWCCCCCFCLWALLWCKYVFLNLYSMIYNSSCQPKHQVVKQGKKCSFTTLICLSAGIKSGKSIYRKIFECKSMMKGFSLAYVGCMVENINTFSMSSTNTVSVVIVLYLLFHPLFSHNFPLFDGIHWGKHKLIFALAIKMRKYLHSERKGSLTLPLRVFSSVCESVQLFHLPHVFDAIFTLKTDFWCKILHLLLQSIEHPSIPADSEKTYTHFIPHVWAIDSQLNSSSALCICSGVCLYHDDAEIRFSIPMFSHSKWIW